MIQDPEREKKTLAPSYLHDADADDRPKSIFGSQFVNLKKHCTRLSVNL